MAKQTRKELGMDNTTIKSVDSACVSNGADYFEKSGIDANILDQAAEIRRNCQKNSRYYNY